MAEHDVALAGIGIAVGIGGRRADQHVVDAVAVHVAGRGDGEPALVAGIDPLDAEADLVRRGR